jgi:hypothetical protein
MGNVLGHFFTGTAIACLLKLTTSVDDLIWCVYCGLIWVSSDARARLAIESHLSRHFRPTVHS